MGVGLGALSLQVVAGFGPLVWAAGEEAAHGGGWFDLVARLVNFGVLAGVLLFLLRKPLASYLEARGEQIRRELTEAVEKRERAAAERAAAESRLAGLEQEVADLRGRARAEAEAEARRILEAAEEDRARIAEAARREIGTELELARRKLTAQATELAVELARKKIAESLNEADRQTLFERSLESLKEAR